MVQRLSGRSPDVLLVVLTALLAVVDIASRALAPLLARADAARLRFLRLYNAPALTMSPLAGLLVLLAVAVAIGYALGDSTIGAPLALVGVARIKALGKQKDALVAEGKQLSETLDSATATAEQKSTARSRRDTILAELDVIVADAAAEQKFIDSEKALILADDAKINVVADAVDRIMMDAKRLEARAKARRVSIFPAAAGFDGPAPFGEYLVAVAQLALTGAVDPRLMAAASGGSAGVPGEGGVMIRPTWSMILLDRAREVSKLLPRTTTIPIGEGSDSIELPYFQQTDRSSASTRFGGVQVYRRAEAAEVTATKVDAFKKFELRLEDMMGLGYVTNRLLRDAVALQAWIENAFASAFSFKVDDELFRGSGSGQCLGAFNAANPNLVSQAKETGQAADTVVGENVINMFARMRPGNMGGARFYINTEMLPLLMRMYISTGTGGQLVYMPPGGLSDAPYGTLLGRPVEALEHCAAKGDVGDIVFADYSDYIVIEKGGLEMAESMHVKFLTDEMTFRFMYRMNGQPKEPAPITPYKGAATLSAFVALAAR